MRKINKNWSKLEERMRKVISCPPGLWGWLWPWNAMSTSADISKVSLPILHWQINYEVFVHFSDQFWNLYHTGSLNKIQNNSFTTIFLSNFFHFVLNFCDFKVFSISCKINYTKKAWSGIGLGTTHMLCLYNVYPLSGQLK